MLAARVICMPKGGIMPMSASHWALVLVAGPVPHPTLWVEGLICRKAQGALGGQMCPWHGPYMYPKAISSPPWTNGGACAPPDPQVEGLTHPAEPEGRQVDRRACGAGRDVLEGGEGGGGGVRGGGGEGGLPGTPLLLGCPAKKWGKSFFFCRRWQWHPKKRKSVGHHHQQKYASSRV